LATHTRDDGFHEIQLNGKQLVFLFMAATVVSVVIFLCGVLVGRGVRAERGGPGADAPLGVAAETTPQQLPPAAAPTPPGSDPTAAQPPPTVDDLSYFNRLQQSNQPAEQLKTAGKTATAPPAEKAAGPPSAENPAATPLHAPTPAPQPPQTRPVKNVNDVKAAKDAAPAPDAVPTNEPPEQGYAVQIAALNVRDEADAIAKRLASKGYAAYVLSPAAGTPQVYRVRVGKFGSRHEAETMAAKLQKEEAFKPWITR